MTGHEDVPRVVSASRQIAASAGRIFELIADPAAQPRWDGNDNLAAAPAGQRVRGPGAVFTMTITKGQVRENHVVEFEEGRQIGWRHFNGHIWRYTFEPVDGGTKVTEQWDATPVWNKFFLRLAGFPKRNRAGIQGTLQRLAEVTADDAR